MVKMSDNMGTSLGLERFMFFSVLFMIGVHICACIWMATATSFAQFAVNGDGKETVTFPGTWVEALRKDPHDLEEVDLHHLYASSFYWAV